MVIDLINNAPSTAYSKDDCGNSVLHIAAEMGNMALVKSLVQMHNFGLLTCTRFVSNLAPNRLFLDLRVNIGGYTIKEMCDLCSIHTNSQGNNRKHYIKNLV